MSIENNLIPPSPQIPNQTLKPFTRFCCTIGNIPTSYLISLSYEEQLLWLCNYLEKTVIPTLNNNSLALKEVQELFIQLKNYVDDYFTNLDVQEEINNKLDEMAENGYFENILTNYIAIQKIYDTTIEMLQDNSLSNNVKIKTLGFYEKNDGGGSEFFISNEQNNANCQLTLENGLFANILLKNNTLNIRQIGARPQDKLNNKYDLKPYLQKYISLLENNLDRIKLYIPCGVWYCTDTQIFYGRGVYIFGDECMTQKTSSNKGTIITTLEDNQQFLWKIGDDNSQMTNSVIKNLLFSTSDYIYSSSLNTFVFDNYKEVIDTCVRFINNQFMITDNLFFENIYGQALGISSCWEIYFKLLNFRGIAGFNKSVLNFEHTSSLGGNITACTFEKIMFEGFSKNLINFSEGCSFAHCDFNTINIEDYPTDYIGETSTPTTSETDYTDFVHLAIFNFDNSGYCQATTVNNILLNNIATDFRTYNQVNYVFDSIIKCGNLTSANMIINNIVTIGIGKNCNLIHQTENNQVSQVTQFTFNNCTCNNTSYKFIFDVEGFRGIIHGDLLNLNLPNKDRFNKIGAVDGFFNLLAYGNIPRGLLFHDEDTINNLKLATKLLLDSDSGNKIFAKFPSLKNKLKIRAKIPNGQEVKIYYREQSQPSSANTSVTLTGTGAYKWYTIYDQNPDENGTIQMSNHTVTSECLIDSFVFE